LVPGRLAGLSIAQQSISFSEVPTGPFMTMEALAGGTGGRAYYNTNDILGSLRNALDDSRVTYSLAFYPTNTKWDGKFHDLKVEVKRPGVKVRARRGYYALPEQKLTPQVRQAVIAETARNPLDATGIGLTATAHKDPRAARALTMSAWIDLRDIRMEQKDGKWTGGVEVVFLELDDQKKILGALEQTFLLNLPDDVYHRLLKEGISYTKQLPISGAGTEMCVVVRDGNTGTIGNIRIPIANYFPSVVPSNR
jgi:hypothetical protein